MTKTKIIFMGTIDFSATVLAGILEQPENYEVVRVVTQPDRKVGRKQVLKASPVKELALEHNLAVLQPEKLSGSEELAELFDLIESEKGEVGIVTAAFGQFLPGKLLDAVKFAVNVHGSLLPARRGGAPIQRAIMEGDKELGITIIEMVRKMDAGDMLAQRAIPCLPEDNSETMFAKLAILGRDLLLECLPDYIAGNLKPEPQDESLVTISPNIAPEEEVIDWTKSAEEINNQIRGLAPSPAAYTFWQGKRFKIYQAAVLEGFGEAGQVVERTKKRLVIATVDGLLELKKVQPFGKGQMDIASFLNGLGRDIQVGDQFVEPAE